MASVLCLGEVMVDWLCSAVNGAVSLGTNFVLDAAGTPANVAVGLKRQGVDSAVIAFVGNDWLGNWLKEKLLGIGVDTSHVVVTDRAPTRAAYVERLPDGERHTLGVTDCLCADCLLSSEIIQPELFVGAEAFYFGSTSLSAETPAAAVRKAIELAQTNNALVVSDSNIWPAMWDDDIALCRETILGDLPGVDLLKLNLSELKILTDNVFADFKQAAIYLRDEYALPLLLVTLGPDGALIVTKSGTRLVPVCSTILVEAAGAGDAFVAGTLAALLPHLVSSKNRRQGLADLDLDLIEAAVKRGNASGAIVCSRVGALSAMPTTAEVESMLAGKLPAAPIPM